MNVIFTALALFFCFRVSAVELTESDVPNISSNLEHEVVWLPAVVVEGGNGFSNGDDNQMRSTVFNSANHFYCSSEEIEDPVLIFYGTKSWTFPAQDVNLTLSYPTAKSQSMLQSEEDIYIISGFKVILYIDGMETKGYILDGGVLQESIVLSFLSPNISSLSYEFWLYGLPKRLLGFFSSRNYLCK